MNDEVEAASALLDEALAWLLESYEEFEFWTERDLVWTIRPECAA
jgi:hypothetical protein